jgi:CheY-like chemotaxis protein
MNKHSVLWADDDPDDLKIFHEAVDEIDHDLVITTVHNGRELLQYLKDAKCSDELPSMIVLDMNMPLLSGREALLEIKRDRVLRDIPVAVFTTSNSPMDLLFCMKFHVLMFTKPWFFAGIKEVISEMLKLRRMV